jgi:SIR2-like domain
MGSTPIVDPITSLSYVMESQPGVYAVLLGSGVSRAAGVPTGWEVVEDLIRKIRAARDLPAGEDPADWFRREYGSDPDFSSLLTALSTGAADRAAILRGYFEPLDGERQTGDKTPTRAHRAIARLVARGLIRVIITTNFDRLMERALEDEGVAPVVISTPAAAVGAAPLAHTRCTVLKINGDYLDSRIKVTADELTAYDPDVLTLLEQVLRDYGLVICGWSAEYDRGLRDALAATQQRRYSAYWTVRSRVSEETARLSNLLGAIRVPVEDADTFFDDLEKAVFAIASLRRPHPLSTEIAVQSLKRYLSEDRYRIDLDDLLSSEVDRTIRAISATSETRAEDPEGAADPYLGDLRRLEAVSETCIRLFATAGRYADPESWGAVSDALSRLLNQQPTGRPSVFPRGLHNYPALLCLYSAGVGAVSSERYGLLAELLRVHQLAEYDQRAASQALRAGEVMNEREVNRIWKTLNARTNDYLTPMSEYLHAAVRGAVSQYIPSDVAYDLAFDRFEYLAALLTAHDGRTDRGPARVHFGRWAYQMRNESGLRSPAAYVDSELEQRLEGWAPLRQGLFGGDMAALKLVKSEIDGWALQLGWF